MAWLVLIDRLQGGLLYENQIVRCCLSISSTHMIILEMVANEILNMKITKGWTGHISSDHSPHIYNEQVELYVSYIVIVWVNEWLSDWVSDWASEWMRYSQPASQPARLPDRQTDRQTDKQEGRQAGRQTDIFLKSSFQNRYCPAVHSQTYPTWTLKGEVTNMYQ